MIKEFLIVRASISSALLRATLFRGFAVALIGICILLVAGSYLPVESLHKWGWGLFLIALGLITWGMLPYRRLSRLQVKPDELVLLDQNHMTYVQRGKKILTIPVSSIAQMRYISHPSAYGIAIWLKPSPSKPVIAHQAFKEVEQMRKQGQRINKADVFLPYFNQRAYDELMDWLFEKEEE